MNFKRLLATVICAMMLLTSVAFAEQVDLPDTYTHATDASSKEVLSGEQLDAARQFLLDSSHYWYINRATPYYGNYTLYPETGFDTQWRSPANGRVYRGPYYDPLTRSVNWLTTSPNGAINSSIGSYWACVAPNTQIEINNNELQGYQVSDEWQMISVMSPGQTVDNFIRNERGSLYIDASLVSNYGLDAGWEYRNILMVEVELDHYVPRNCTPEEYYNGELPTTSSWLLEGRVAGVESWAGQFLTIPQYWGCATGDDAAKNLTTDEERAAYIESLNADPEIIEAMSGVCYYMHFNILQIVNVKQELGFDFEQASGKVNAIDMDHDGLLDRYPEGNAKAGELILQNEALAMLPDWAYELNQNLDWWIAGSGDLINSQGKKLVGANPDGTYILEGDPNAPVVEEEAESTEPEIQLADNEKLGVGNGNGGELTVKVTLDGDAIAAVEILSHNETAGIADAALEQVPAAIVEANSADVDGVSGATMTSNAIKDAVKDALAQ